MKICGPKLSLFGVIVSVWGIIQLGMMGFFYYDECITLVHDLPLKEHYYSMDEFYEAASDAYLSNAYNCWIAACLYVLTLLFSLQQFNVNSQETSN